MTIEQDGLNLTVLKILNKRLSLALYRQLPIIHIMKYNKKNDHNKLICYCDPDTSKPKLKGRVIGKIASKVGRLWRWIISV